MFILCCFVFGTATQPISLVSDHCHYDRIDIKYCPNHWFLMCHNHQARNNLSHINEYDLKCIYSNDIICFVKTHKFSANKYQYSITKNEILQSVEYDAHEEYKGKYPDLYHWYKLSKPNDCNRIGVYLDVGDTIIQQQQMGPSPVALINVVSVLSKLNNDALTNDMNKWWERRDYFKTHFADGIQCR